MELKITTDWILTTMPHTYHSDGCRNAILMCTIDTYDWVKLALDELKVKYEEDEVFMDSEEFDPDFMFTFVLDDIKESCPKTYLRLLAIDTDHRPTSESNDYISTNGKTFSFEECEKFIDIIPTDNLGLLAKHLCVDEIAKDIEGFFVRNEIIYIDLYGEIVPLKKEG